MEKNNANIDPYKIFFPVGLLSAAIGLFLWILFQNRGIQYYPRPAHANLMFFCFLWSFIAGFLMTAVPKMTGTKAASFFEMFVGILLVFLQIAVNLRGEVKLSFLLFLFQTLYLILFVTKRFWVKKQIPFEGFLFIPFAFAQSILGIFIFFNFNSDPAILYLLSGEAFILNLIMGIGSRLIPVLSRVPNALAPDIKSPLFKKLEYLFLAAVLNLGFLVQAFGFQDVGTAIKLSIILFISIRYLKLFSKGTSLSFVAIGLKLGIVFVIASYVAILGHANPIASQHLLYIGGFFLITLMVGTRVMLAHGGESLDKEIKSKKIVFVLSLLFLSAIFRFLAGSDISGTFLKVALYCALTAVFIWSYKFAKILLKTK